MPDLGQGVCRPSCWSCERYGPPHDGSPCGWCGRQEGQTVGEASDVCAKRRSDWAAIRYDLHVEGATEASLERVDALVAALAGERMYAEMNSPLPQPEPEPPSRGQSER